MPPKKKEVPSFEQSLARLGEIVSLLSTGNAPLAESLSLFEEGAGLLKQCTTQLAEAEEKVSLLLPDSQGEPTLAPFGEEYQAEDEEEEFS